MFMQFIMFLAHLIKFYYKIINVIHLFQNLKDVVILYMNGPDLTSSKNYIDIKMTYNSYMKLCIQ